MASVRHSSRTTPTWTRNLCHESNKATPGYLLVETQPAWERRGPQPCGHPPCGPQVALPWKHSWLGEVKTHILQLRCKRKTQVCRSRLPLLGAEINFKIQAILMASVGRHQVGSPPLGPQYMSRKQVRPHQAGSPPDWNPTCLKQQTPTFLCPLPTPSLLGEVKTSSSQRCWNRKYPGFQK